MKTYCCTEISRTTGDISISIGTKDGHSELAHVQIKLSPSEVISVCKRLDKGCVTADVREDS